MPVSLQCTGNSGVDNVFQEETKGDDWDSNLYHHRARSSTYEVTFLQASTETKRTIKIKSRFATHGTKAKTTSPSPQESRSIDVIRLVPTRVAAIGELYIGTLSLHFKPLRVYSIVRYWSSSIYTGSPIVSSEQL